MVSQGVPMILSGDEMGVTKYGNNNTYCHDNDLNYINWDLVEKNSDIFKFAQHITRFRRAHPVLRSRTHFQHRDYVGSGYPDISLHGTVAWQPDFSPSSRCLAFMLDGAHAKGGTIIDDTIYVAMNSYWDALYYELPVLPTGRAWYIAVNTDMPSGEDAYAIGKEARLDDQTRFLVGGRSTVILVGK
jgi:isoamylase